MNIFTRIARWLRRTPEPERRREAPGRRSRATGSAPENAQSAGAASVTPSTNAAMSADAVRSAIRKGFNATQPVTAARHLHGRQQEMDLLVEGVLDRGNHAMIFGGRGTGKTSLARVFANVADNRGYLVFYMACEPGQDFTSLIAPFLDAARGNLPRSPATDAPIIVGPRDVVEALAEHGQRKFIFILDEFDRITAPAVLGELSRTMKLLSDAALPVHILAVGIASGLSQLIEGHESLRRHMTAVPIVRIDTSAVFDLIDRGASQAGLNFSDAARETIAHVACGSPYHVRLFCALACLETLRQRKTVVEMPATLAGMMRAVDDWTITNPTDAALFHEAIDLGAGHWPVIEQVVRAAIVPPGLAPEQQAPHIDRDGPVLEILRRAMHARPGSTALMFRDSLAPQFLLGMLSASRHGDHLTRRVVSLVEGQRQSAAS